MPKFNVTIYRTKIVEEVAYVEIEAENANSAWDAAHEIDVQDSLWSCMADPEIQDYRVCEPEPIKDDMT